MNAFAWVDDKERLGLSGIKEASVFDRAIKPLASVACFEAEDGAECRIDTKRHLMLLHRLQVRLHAVIRRIV